MSDTDSRTDQVDFFCADVSREAGEPMIGTAPAVEAWFLLEYAGPWMAKATEDNDLPPSTQAWLANALALVAKGRVQFIKHSRASSSTGITFFLALTREVAPLLYEFHLDTYADLHSLDLVSLLAGDAGRQHLLSEPLYLVCTNGRRDRCCSRLGQHLYLALDERVGDAAWKTTHLGGHRFAPTLVTFPDGTCYGRLEDTDLPPLVQAQEAGHLYLSRLRGRSCYDDLVQAADYFLRQKTGFWAGDGYRLLDARPGDGAQWLVRFIAPSTGQIYRLRMVKTLSEPSRLVSCSPPKSKLVPQFHLISVEQQ
ncbi:MAG: sucrase ferredoxin [Candidatus Promineifilaceae bacterium]